MEFYIGLYIYGTVCSYAGIRLAKADRQEYQEMSTLEKVAAAAAWPIMLPALLISSVLLSGEE